jgi:hypothetical protein
VCRTRRLPAARGLLCSSTMLSRGRAWCLPASARANFGFFANQGRRGRNRRARHRRQRAAAAAAAAALLGSRSSARRAMRARAAATRLRPALNSPRPSRRPTAPRARAPRTRPSAWCVSCFLLVGAWGARALCRPACGMGRRARFAGAYVWWCVGCVGPDCVDCGVVGGEASCEREGDATKRGAGGPVGRPRPPGLASPPLAPSHPAMRRPIQPRRRDWHARWCTASPASSAAAAFWACRPRADFFFARAAREGGGGGLGAALLLSPKSSPPTGVTASQFIPCL